MLSSMAADRARILILNAKIDNAYVRSLAALRAEQSLVQGRLDSYTYPILTLCHEITSEIFTHVVPPYPDTPPLVGIDSPISLAHVCRKWRSVAFATPALWRAIEFCTPQLPSDQICGLFDELMSRSGSLPLSICIDSCDDDFLHRIFTDAEPGKMASARWEHLTVDAPLLRLPKIGSPMPMLRSLTLSASASGRDDFILHEVPLLRTVILSGNITSKIILPWHHLTSLTLELVSVDECLRILPQAVNLIYCTLIFQNDGEDQLVRFDREHRLVLPCLESLVFEDRSREQTSVIVLFEALIVPALRNLELDETIFESEGITVSSKELIAIVKWVISESRCMIQGLHITKSSSTCQDYRLAFPTIPAVSISMWEADHEDSTDDSFFEEQDEDEETDQNNDTGEEDEEEDNDPLPRRNPPRGGRSPALPSRSRGGGQGGGSSGRGGGSRGRGGGSRGRGGSGGRTSGKRSNRSNKRGAEEELEGPTIKKRRGEEPNLSGF
ncbi:hypothetical protein C8R45DRAFT_1047855 [Mycena sanguinolenta]|nr:hypothetical protein C8R45DRAFT_1047855 [Mycena sanguinolenta]